MIYYWSLILEKKTFTLYQEYEGYVLQPLMQKISSVIEFDAKGALKKTHAHSVLVEFPQDKQV